MSTKKDETSNRWYRLFAFMTVVLTLGFLVGCAAGNYGAFDRDRDLYNMYLNYEVLPDHNYYTTGGYDGPRAILAIHEDYQLDNTGNLWVYRPDADSALMRKWITTIAPYDRQRWSENYFASYILGPDGKRVGAWFANESTTTVKFLEGNRIQVYPPAQKHQIDMDRKFRNLEGFNRQESNGSLAGGS